MFLPFGLRTAPRIFNLFAEALHWIFEESLKWKVIYYLNDFLFVFPVDIKVSELFNQYDNILIIMSLIDVIEKNMNDHIIIYLDFEFDTFKMEIYFSINKKLRALQVI